LCLGGEQPVVFEGWLKDAFGTCVEKGTAFAKAIGPAGHGFIVTNGPMFLSSAEPLVEGSIVSPGDLIAFGAADGENIPYGKPYCVFIPSGIIDQTNE
ncbi:MAG TPA: hypothetical protein VH088_10430, partial [Terriglobales bacterium]|nr:hypothetical protein [Terriglobales bacterium]